MWKFVQKETLTLQVLQKISDHNFAEHRWIRRVVISLDPVYGFFTVFGMLMVDKQSNTKKVESQSIRRKNNKLNTLNFFTSGVI